jgi:hypothetical protein
LISIGAGGIRANHNSPQEQRFFNRSKVFETQRAKCDQTEFKEPFVDGMGRPLFPE